MKAQHISFFLLAGLVTFNACRKDGSAGLTKPDVTRIVDTLPHEPGLPAPNLPASQNRISNYRLSSIDYNSDPGGTAYYHYNGDGTTRQVQYSARHSGTTNVDYTYDNNALSEIMAEHSEYKTKYTYEKGWISTISHVSSISNRGYKFLFTYNTNGTVARMKYYNINEAGDVLIYTNTYTYDTNGLVKKITAVANNSTSVILSINSYSSECDFNPLTFSGITLGDQYELFNQPVMSQLKRLPARITKTFLNNAGAVTSEVGIDYNYTITGTRLDKVVTSIRYPANPQSNSSSEMVFHY
ncbi:hypothetical protein D3H65_29125 [Paraflavitalea soli]|uniref:DUF4595 domain-containing protein n=1 Tax=Paraflavitalea soli TaxID=2315862 RepID=A0A3B7MTG3_9BACT|nr:hypothetical protein [Paraflavitalea soli]AXY77802.1 hypothetical protein D3H65_29125 [Paraflavitalea soli]